MKRSLKVLLALLSLASGLASAEANKVSSDLQETGDAGEVDVIVQFVTPQSGRQIAGVGTFKASFSDGSQTLIHMSAAAAKGLAKNPNVRFVSPDRKVTGTLEHANPGVYADMAFSSGWTGAGVGVAIIDSGIIDFPDFDNSACGASRIVYSANFVAGESSSADTYGHGTHVAGIIGGNSKCATPMSRLFRGIAPSVNLISLRALNASGVGTDSAVISAIDRAISLKNTYNIRVLNLSLGRGVTESYKLDPLCQAVERAWKAGIVVVVSAGNMGRYPGTSGYGMISSPGNDPFVITVGAMNDKSSPTRADDIMTTYSSKGPSLIDHVLKPDLVAPGNSIMSVQAQGSTLAKLLPGNIPPRSYYYNTTSPLPSTYYMRLSGTSMAAPMVSGAAALIIQKTPGLTPNQVKARLMKTASKNLPYSMSVYDPSTNSNYTIYNDAFTVGAGYLDVNAALANGDVIKAASTTPLSPLVTFDAVTKKVSLVTANSLVWGDSVVWGDSLVWGDSVVWGDRTLFGCSIVWGDTATKANSLVWGDSLVPAQSVIWGDSTTANAIQTSGDK